ncbi:MAG: protein kinase [Pseudomonadota bacterium]
MPQKKKTTETSNNTENTLKDYELLRKLTADEEPSSWTSSYLAKNPKTHSKVILSRLNKDRYINYYSLSNYTEETKDTYKGESEKKYDEKVNRFVEICEKVREFHHPNITQIFDVLKDFETGEPIVVTDSEYIKGRQIYEATGGMDVLDMMPIFLSELEAVEFMHRKGLLHLNIKSRKIRVYEDETYEIKFTDCGFAADMKDVPEDILGTPLYSAPEVILMAKDKIGAPSDLYSLAVLAYACMSRVYPFNHRKAAKSIPELKERIYRESTPILPSEQNRNLIDELSDTSKLGNVKEFEKLIVQQLNPNPNERPFKTAHDFKEKIIDLFPEAIEMRPLGNRTLTLGSAPK